MQPPLWVLSLSFWLHMLATIMWFGGIGLLSLVVVPIAEKQFSKQQFAKFLKSINRILDPIGWLSLSILTVTGLFQMSGNENYEGFLNFQSSWAFSLLVKHILFGIVILLSSIYTWKISPTFEREIFKLSQNISSEDFLPTYKKSQKIKMWSFISGVFILLFTAISRIS